MGLNVVAFWTSLLATSFYALQKGGAPEKWTAAMYVASAAATTLTFRTFAHRFSHVEPFAAAIDVVLLFGLTVILLRADRFWPIAAFAIQGVAVLTHTILLVDPTIVRKAYAIALALSGWLTVVVLAVAVRRNASRTVRFGMQRDWS